MQKSLEEKLEELDTKEKLPQKGAQMRNKNSQNRSREQRDNLLRKMDRARSYIEDEMKALKYLTKSPSKFTEDKLNAPNVLN